MVLFCIFVCVYMRMLCNSRQLKVLFMLNPVDLTVHLTLCLQTLEMCVALLHKKTHFIAHD